MSNYKRGVYAEGQAVAFLQKKGYRILEQRYKTPYGEIDIIAKDEECFVFIEVKQRKTLYDAGAAIHVKNRSRVIAAAQVYLQKLDPDEAAGDIRFDAVMIARHQEPVHVENAWGLS